MRKKGAIEIQFNWILVLAAGAVVIIIFMSFISKQQEIHDFSTGILAANSLGSVFSSYNSADISAVVEMPKSRIELNCNSFSVDGIPKNMDALNFFSPSALETDKMNLWSLGWDIPYRAANFLYITSPDVRYIFIGNSEFAGKMFEKIRGKARADGFTNAQAVEDENNIAVRIIFFGQEPKIPESLKAANYPITSLRVDGNEDRGMIEFFELADGKFESRGKSDYIGGASLFGAIFSDDAERYNCVMEKAFNKLNIVSEAYLGKINNIIKQYAIDGKNPICMDFYQNNLLAISDSISELSSFDPAFSNYEDIINAADYIETINNEADALSCALIY